MKNKLREEIAYLYMKALGNVKLPENTWKKIAKVNKKVLDCE